MARTGFTIWALRGQDKPGRAEEVRMLKRDCALGYGRTEATAAELQGSRGCSRCFCNAGDQKCPGRGRNLLGKLWRFVYN